MIKLPLRRKMMKHRHRFNDDGINLLYCSSQTNDGCICPIAKDKETGKVGKFVVIKGRGYIPD